MTTVMTAQPPLPLAPPEATPVGEAAALIEDAHGGRVFLHGELWLAWQAGDELTRRLAAVQLVRIKAATARAVAAAFGVNRETLRRWAAGCDAAGAVGLVPDRRGPKGPSKLTVAAAAQIRSRRASGESLRVVAAATGVSITTVRRVLTEEATTGEHAGDDEHDLDNEHDDEATTGEEDLGAGDTAGDTASDDETGEDTIAENGGGLPLLADPARRPVERGLARWGLLAHAEPVFTPAARVPLAGLLLALPALAATGLLAVAENVYGRLPNGFYGLKTVLVEAVLRTLAAEPRAEGATRIDPIALGRVLGLDRSPEVKTIRRKFGQLAGTGKAEQLLAGIARHHLHQADQTDPGLLAVLYVDGHTRAYHGKRDIGKTHVARLKFPAPATAETWVADAAGDPVLVVMAEAGASLAGELRRLLPELRKAIGDDRRVLVGFDRGGWSPRLFHDMRAAGFDVLTWRKGAADDVEDAKFTDLTYTDPDGRVHTWNTAETTVVLPIDDKGKETISMRQITRRDGPGARQAHILTTAAKETLSTVEVNYRMGSRWRQENMFRYGRMHFDLDSHDCYDYRADDPARSVPNPAKAHARNAVAAARARRDREAARVDTALLQRRCPPPGEQTVITNGEYNQITAGLRVADEELSAAEAANRATPTRLPLGQVNPGQQVLEVDTKLLTHAVKIAAFNTTSTLARDLRLHTGYARARDEAHTLIRQTLTHSGDIAPDVDTGTLTVRLDPMPTGRATRAITELCAHLTDTETRYPGTDLVLRYEIKPRN